MNTTDSANQTAKLPLKRKVGYAVGIFSDSLGYTMFYSFFSLFLTTVVGLPPALAGAISSVGIFWDGITDPVVGHISDLKAGRKRKFIQGGAILYALALVMVYIKVDFGLVGTTIYYVVCVLAFWLFYTMVCVPYYSSVPELTSDYHERTSIRNLSATLNTFTNWLVLSTPMLLVTFFSEQFKSKETGWLVTAGIFASCIIIFSSICARSLKKISQERGTQEVAPHEKVSLLQTLKDLVSTYWGILKLKPTKWLMLAIFSVNLFRGVASAGYVYYMSYVVGWNAAQIGLAYSVLVLSWLPFFPLIQWVCKKWDRRTALIGAFAITAIGRTIIYFTGMSNTPVGAYSIIIISNFLLTTYLALMFAMPYDIAELYEFKTGKRRDSAISAVPLMCQKLGSAVAVATWGIMLQASQFNAKLEVQTAETLASITRNFAGVINIFIFVSIAFLLCYRLTKKKVTLLQKAVELKRENKPYSTEGFEDLI